jgi:hypothetical protein
LTHSCKGSTKATEDGGVSFAAFYVKEDKVIAVATLMKDPVVSHVSELLRLKKMPTATQIRSGLDVLSIPLGHSP